MKKTQMAAALAGVLLSAQLMAQTVVTVNGTKIDSDELDARAKFVQQQSQGQVKDSPELRQFIANEVVVETVVVQEARRLKLDQSTDYKTAEADARRQARDRGLDKQPNFQAHWKRFLNQVLMDVYAQHIVQQDPVTDAQLQERYNAIKTRYDNTDEVQIGEIITDKAEQAQAAIRELAAKKSFADVARKYSIDPEVKAGQSAISDFMALVDLKEARPKIFAAVQNLKAGEFTRQALNEDNKAFVVFYMSTRRKIAVEPFEKVREGLLNNMRQERVQAAVGALMQKANIVPAQ